MAAGTKQPPFFCPLCGQKHRADLSALRGQEGATLRTRCRQCGAGLAVGLEDGQPVTDVTEAPPETPAPVAQPDPVPTPAPAGGPYEDDVELASGATVGRYEIQALLRRGHTSAIYRAHDPETKRTVALKVLDADADAATRRRFERQIEVQGRIRHPNVLPVYDRGVLPDGRPFFAAELLNEPSTLAELVQAARAGDADATATVGLVREVLIPIAEGAYVANVENGQIHRDLRPENVLVDGQTGRPYIADFSHAAPPSTTERAPAVPLSHFVAPETTIHRAHARTDVWGLGGLLHLVLTGEPPLGGRGRALLDAARQGRVEDLPADAPPALAAVARKALAPDPEKRYVNARQMAADLRAWLQGGTVRAVEEFGDQAAHRVEVREALARVGRMALWVLGGLLLGLLVGSRIRPGGQADVSPEVSAAAAEADRIDREVTGLVTRVGTLDAAEAARTWAAITERLDDVARRATAAGETAAQDVVARTRHTRGRLLVPRIEVRGPEGLALVAENRTLGGVFDLAGAGASLPPGRYEVRDAEGRVRFPLRLGLDLAPQGVTKEAPVLLVDVPADALAPPESAVFVPRGVLPPAAGSRTTAPFFLDRRPVLAGQWRTFVGSLDDEGRAALGADPVSDDAADEDVVRVTVAQAQAYCRWRAGRTGRRVELPSVAEWQVAAGATLVEGPLSPPPPAAPHGLVALGEAAEMVLLEGRGVATMRRVADAETAAWLFEREPLDEDERAAFRCLYPLR